MTFSRSKTIHFYGPALNIYIVFIGRTLPQEQV